MSRGLFGALAAGVGSLEAKSVGFDDAFVDFFAGAASKTGIHVTVEKALKATTVLACTRVLAEGIAQPPFRLYRTTGQGHGTPATDHPLFKLLGRRPNDWMTSFELRETMMFHAVLKGAGYCYINRLRGEIRELLPLCGSVTPRQSPDFEVVFEVADANGIIGTYPRKDIFQVRGPSWDGVKALDILRLAREAIGLSLAGEESHARFHGNSARPAGILSIDGTLSDIARARIIKQAQDQSGLLNAGKTLVLDKGATWTAAQMSGVDGQQLETRKFQIEEVCRTLRVFPQMVGHTAGTVNFASAEAFFQAHVVHSLAPWAERWDQSAARDLISEDGLFAKIDLRGLVRGDIKTRSTSYSQALGAGGSPAWMTQDEVRALEDLPPMGGAAAVLPVPTNVPGKPPKPANDDPPSEDA